MMKDSLSRITKEVPGARPCWGGQIEAIIMDIRSALEEGQLSQGDHLKRFESDMAAMTGSQYAVGVNSGGTGLQLILQALDLRGREVIVPTDTFVASANAVILAGGRPVFADINPDTLCLDPEDVARRITDQTAAIMTVHMFGLVPEDFRTIREMCIKRGLFLIEDAAHAHGAALGDEMAGNLGEAACFSFYATKIATTGEGGVITTNNETLYKKLLQLRNHGKSIMGPLFEIVSNNYRLSEIQAILGHYQMIELETNIKRRNEIADSYYRELSECEGLQLLPRPSGSTHAYWRFPLYLSDPKQRGPLQKELWDKERVRITWMYEPLCHLQPVFMSMLKHNPGDYPRAEDCMEKLVCLPVHGWVSDDDAERICHAVKNSLLRM